VVGSSGATNIGTGSLSSVVAMLLSAGKTLARLADVKTKVGGVDVAVEHDENDTEARLSKNIKDAIEDCLGVGVDDIATFAQAPSNGVEEPETDKPDTTEVEGLLGCTAKSICMAASVNEDLVDDKEEGGAANGEESPLVSGLYKSTNETSDNHDLVGKHGSKNGGGGHASSEHEVEQEERSGDDPVNVTGVKDLTSAGGVNLRAVRADKLGLDGGLSKIGAHGKVGDARRTGDGCSNVVEEALGLGLAESQAHEGKRRNTHNGANGKEPVRAMVSDLKVGALAHDRVDEDSVVGHFATQRRAWVAAKV